MFRRTLRIAAALLLTATASLVVATTTAAPAQADTCYTWPRYLHAGMTGDDVRQLQIRISGYPAYGQVLALDGSYGPATEAAVRRFQQAWGLTVDGKAGPQTLGKIYDLQDGDCTPANFSYSEMNRCNSDWSGGAVSASTAKFNALVVMWKLEAMRHALGDVSINISSGFRSYACNSAVGGSPTSKHVYGLAADLIGRPSLCTLAKQSRYHGFNLILGPGYPDHNDHTHVATQTNLYWEAPSCGI
ncbi:zinc D-Ala-D-Ala carboxypeptidase [Micromonospora pallida]|uniref:Zinc D-Ala-D-Ala carboxypeptidase n=1 Tax=Micromonospora pallida TaxID=145854 RepID=A0A1C6SUE3_9ACTN|nr:D-Ala-D-Ala carboxypeptidase family metallohydrolase [Micromonospora pallida]SCL33196.1 zinc D-Ala-D-Ala carboxypeptidase [Micromonospora pallida]